MKTTVASDVASQPGGARTADGALWFTTMKGLVKVNPRHMLHNDLVPPVVVETVVTDGISHVYSDRLVIAPGNKAIEFHYTALSFRVPERVRFKYQLEGYDHGWVDAGSRRVAYYTNLPPGHYRFRVIAANDDGVWNEEGAAIGVELQPHYYQTVPFYLLCACLAGALAVTGNMRYTRIMRARAEHLRQVVEDRTADLRKSQWELEQLALFDTLTALPNRRLFKADFSKLCTQSRWSNFALLLIDFDKFKSINDSYGHDAGDAFLIEAASRLEAAVRATDLVARLGGDEFAILLTGEHDRASIESLCNRIVESFAAEVWFKGVNIVTSASLGVAVFPEHGETQEQLYKAADLALYAAKRMGRNKWVLYLPEMQEVKPGLTPV
jgi:diguanylate cyclase (GGDEF)-like protein